MWVKERAFKICLHANSVSGPKDWAQTAKLRGKDTHQLHIVSIFITGTTIGRSARWLPPAGAKRITSVILLPLNNLASLTCWNRVKNSCLHPAMCPVHFRHIQRAVSSAPRLVMSVRNLTCKRIATVLNTVAPLVSASRLSDTQPDRKKQEKHDKGSQSSICSSASILASGWGERLVIGEITGKVNSKKEVPEWGSVLQQGP